MRANRLIYLLFLLMACKATTPSSSSTAYSEDLSVHRPSLETENKTQDSVVTKASESYVELQGHIRSELDSISKIAFIENKNGKMVDGFVIQVYSGNDRNLANEVRSKTKEFFPELNPKMTYHQPNFRVKAGQFSNRLEANRIYQQLKEEFPKALLIPDRFLLKYE